MCEVLNEKSSYYCRSSPKENHRNALLKNMRYTRGGSYNGDTYRNSSSYSRHMNSRYRDYGYHDFTGGALSVSNFFA